MKQMLYEAVFWRQNPNKPPFEEGLSDPGVNNALLDWGKRDGDTAVIAQVDSMLAGLHGTGFIQMIIPYVGISMNPYPYL